MLLLRVVQLYTAVAVAAGAPEIGEDIKGRRAIVVLQQHRDSATTAL